MGKPGGSPSPCFASRGMTCVEITTSLKLLVMTQKIKNTPKVNDLWGVFCNIAIPLKLRGEVEANILEILLRKGESIAGVGEEDIASVLINSHICVLATLEVG